MYGILKKVFKRSGMNLDFATVLQNYKINLLKGVKQQGAEPCIFGNEWILFPD